MSLVLHDLLVCCHQLEKDKVTERRKEIEKFKRLIRDSETIQQLDRNSDSKQGKQLNWDAVFRFLQTYIQKEMESLRLAKPNVSLSTQSSRQKKMQEIGSLVKYFIRCANKRAPRLKCQELLNYIIKIVRDASSCAVYGTDCSTMLLKDVLSERKYWCEISLQQWSELLPLYCRLYLKPSKEINRVLVARIIHTLTRGYCFQTDGLNINMFSFFSKAMQCAREEKNSAGLDHILAAVNIFCSVFAVNCRIQVCKLGEEILPKLLYVWTQHRPKDSLKELIIELLNLQVRIHHPKGAKIQEKGAYVSAKWQSILHNLYDLLMNEISLIGSRGKYSSGSRNIAVKENLIELMADICHQVFTEDTKVLEISQPYTITQREAGDGTAPSKRRRIELGWEVIRGSLQRSQNDFDVIPWLQIATRLISKYPMSLPTNELPLLLTILHQLLPQQRRGERTPYVLRCLAEVALCQNQKSDLKSSLNLELQRIWTKIWSLTVRSISFQQIETESFGLLRAIIQGNLVVLDRELWKMFLGSACKPSSPAACCLASVMTACVVPETLEVGKVQNNCEGNTGYLLKEAIMKWLLFCHLEEVMDDCMEPSPVLCSDFPHLVLQKILVSLTMKNCRAAMTFFQNVTKCVQHTQGEVGFSEVEELYLQTTFDDMSIFASHTVNAADKNLPNLRFTVNQDLRETLERYLLVVSEQLSNICSSELSTAEHLVRGASLLTGVLGCYCHIGTITEEDACKSDLFQKAKTLMHYVGESIFQSKSKLNEDSRIISLRNLITHCSNCLCNCTKSSPSKVLSGLFQCLLTSKLMNDLVDICKHLMSFNGKPNETGEAELMEDDLEESTMEVENQVTVDLFTDHRTTAMSETNEAGEVQNITGAMSPLAEEHLTKQDYLLLEILRFLCICVTTSQIHTVSFRASDIRRKLLMLIEKSTFDASKSLHLHVYLVLLKELPVEENMLPEEDIVMLLKPLSDVCSMYRRDQEVCKAVISNLLPIAVGLGQASVNAEETGDAQGQFLTVVGAFWHLTKEGRCTAPVRVALLKCMKALLEADPYSKWAILRVRNEDLLVSEAFPHFLADSHHQVRMLAAKSITSLFQDVKQRDLSGLLKPLPLKLQQKAFENVYLRVQEGMRDLTQANASPDDLDKECNRKAVLLTLITMVLCCSPVCEKQALFAICQSVKENGLEAQLIKKVLERVSDIFGYRSIEDFMNSHLDYLVLEWLRMKDSGYTLSAFPYVLLNYSSLEEFYKSCYKVLVPHLVIRSQFEDVKSIANRIEKDWRNILSDCFPKILVNILPYFAYQSNGDSEIVLQRETACKVYDMLTDEDCLGKQQIDNLSHSNFPEIVLELLMTLHEPANTEAGEGSHLSKFTGDLDPAPNPPHFPSYVIKATLDYISSCHKAKLKSLVAVLSKNPDSFQKILLAICKQATDTNNIYKKHRILIIYHLFVNLLLKEIKDGLGGAWAFVLRDVIYTLIHHITNRPIAVRDVSMRSFSLCCDLLNRVCHAAVTYCKDALESHLHVIVGTLIPLVGDQPEIQEQVLDLLKYLVIDNKDNENLYQTIKHLDPFPEHPAFKDLRTTQQKIKYSKGSYSLLEEINHFLSVSVCDSLPLTRLEGLRNLRKQLEQHKDQMRDLIKDFQENPVNYVIVKLVVSLLQISKMAINHPGEKAVLEAVGSCLGEVGPIDFSTIALQHSKNVSYSKATDLFEDRKLQLVFIMLTQINNALIDVCINVRSAAASCLKNILATKSGNKFWEAYKDKADPMLIYLHPFRMSRKKFLEVPDTEKETPSEAIDDANLWIPQGVSHETWIKNLTCSLLNGGGVKDEVLLLLKPMCEVKTDFCQTLLPYLIHDILLHDSNESWRNLLSVHIQRFFTTCCRCVLSSSRSTTPANSDSEPESLVRRSLDKISRRTMLTVVDHLRRQKRSLSGTIFDDSFWLDLNYLEVAMAAQSCSAHFTALLYAEIYADKINTDKQQQRSALKASKNLMFEEESQDPTIARLSEKSREETGISLQDLLMEIYRSIGEPDSLYGCGGGRILQPLARIRTYEHEAAWGKALLTYDLEASLPSSVCQAGIIEALQNFGLCHTLATYLKGLEHENTEWCAELEEIRYQAAWRNMQWGHIPSVKDEAKGPSYHELLYDALQSLRDREFSTFYDSLKEARVKEVEELCKGSLESVYSLYPTLCRLQAVGELENIGQIFSRSVTNQQLAEIYLKWQRHSQLLKDSDFCFQEPVMALRTVILEVLLEKETENCKRDCIKDILTKHLVELSKLARTAKNTQLPERAMFRIKQCNPARYGVSEWQLEEAQVFWAKKEESLALSVLKDMIKKLDTDWFQVENDPRLRLMYTECVRLCGNWLAETCLENPTVIMQKYLEKAVEVAAGQSGDSSDELKCGKMKAFLSLARFSDTQYQRIENYMKSSEFENKQALLKAAKEEVGLIRECKVQTNRYTVKVQRELELDECAINALKEDCRRFLCKAIENYISCLLSGEEHDMWIFRLCSLWLENSGVPEVNGMMKKNAKKIPSYKFLPLMYQLAARMGTKKMGGLGFHEVLNNLISSISLDHPHHTLFIILALANAKKDELLTKPETRRSSALVKNAPKEISPLDMDRMEAANNIINIIKSRKASMVRGVEALCDAYITLANLDATPWKSQRKGISIPAEQPITKLKNLEDVVVPTMEIKVDPTGKYENLVTIRSFKPEFRLAGGLNLPKIIDCIGSDGKERRQLVKGRDDLRQDAVMQQVFQMCNMLLQQNTETRKRKLTIRRYKVVPLSQRSGVLEWCSGTTPIGEFLVNPQEGAHSRYRPKDYSSFQAHKAMMDAQKKHFEEKYIVFMDICKNFQPVFRYFCMEKFLDPAVWFEKRLAYTRSVATSSIVGYILGLGDRHVQNILIDEQTAELVHIDLGVAFEQGKILPTPETVPFRLTRDIVDGMGITGVEGVFRRCCEKTMAVMRNSQEALLTIVEVLLYDPLFDWTMNPLKALYLQQRPEDKADISTTLNVDHQQCNRKANDQSFNKVAERVLMRLQEKLKGVEEGIVLSVGGQVNLLIQQAMDPKNLSRLFPGWKPWV
ncbi:serine-protein kinase ATM isoform X2 [Alligator mississippiensis]|uniref:non-specific serine/threonine protein kinase n=1 Tax=Alligator mississippiensis TaxID=8496 RepID=A0A151P7C2_ALLMI|nr:serine-protein kinase ATM isoform X2 [Alligator mississippiensis]KYO44923.1 serine-protein kinase ATM [Alligator mississippiensis]